MLFKKEIEFVRDFTSPTLGNVYRTKRVTLPAKEAEKFIAGGFAVEVGAAEKKPAATSAPAPADDPYKGMTKKQKEAAIKAAEAKAKVDAEIAEKQARLDELTAKDGLSDDEADEAAALEEDLKALKGE